MNATSAGNKKIRARLIIFDLDGTLIDSSEDIAWAANKTLQSFGRKTVGIAEIKKNIGWGIKMLIERLMPGEAPIGVLLAREKFLEFYSSRLAVSTTLYPGVTETLTHLKSIGKVMALATNKPAALSDAILGEFGLRDFFAMTVGGDSFTNRKPHPEPLTSVLSALGFNAADAVMIGDSPMDCEAAMAAGTRSIGVTYGFRSPEDIKKAGFDAIVDALPEIVSLLE